ncbi:putative membrane protein [Halogranum amylolyticum]|uniref:Putative membrane protein n=1 Tax=Halogranum amylolyticum TaxID=660520 RepID=A0A1H8U0A8_9EURY|nr:PH domain-containing protein [Halogranum amylolyticum]SEO96567.1 putative membrane protein [Halogranum amylolyticum]
MKLSPLSVPYKAVQKGASIVFTLAFVLFSGASAVLGGLGGPLVTVGLLGGIVVLLVAYEVLYYRRYEYELTADTFDIRSGVVSRRNREIPLRRIQNVDISRNVVQRVLGIAALNFETAGGSGTEAAIRYVTFEEAKRLQNEIARLKRGDAADAPEVESDELFALSDRELAIVGALSFDPRGLGILFFLLSGSIPVVSSFFSFGGETLVLALGGLVVLVAILFVSWLAGFVIAVVNYYGFRLSRTDDELLYERGLLQRYDGSIPFDKIQTLTIEDNPLKRRFGYATLAIETAGYAPGQGSERGSEAAVPLATRQRVVSLANDIEAFGTPTFTRPPKRIRRRYTARYLIILGVVTGALFAVVTALDATVPWYGTLAVLPVIPVAAHYKWKHRGYWLGENHVVTRNGFWKRQTKVVPYYRIQTVIDSRTIFQRRWRVATVTVDTAGSLSLAAQDAAAVDIEAADAERVRAELEDRLVSAVADRRSRRRRSRRPLVGPVEPGGDDSPPNEGSDPTDDTTPDERSDAREDSNPSGA